MMQPIILRHMPAAAAKESTQSQGCGGLTTLREPAMCQLTILAATKPMRSLCGSFGIIPHKLEFVRCLVVSRVGWLAPDDQTILVNLLQIFGCGRNA